MDAKKIARFWAKVDRNGPTPQHRPDLGACWVWTGSKISSRSGRGYGRLGYCNRLYLAHRFAWLIAGHDIPDGLCVLHKCDNPSCVRAEHLFVGTHAENMGDKVLKGRQSRGEKHSAACPKGPRALGSAHPNSKLTEASVRSILDQRSRGATLRSLGEQFGVSISAVWLVIKRRNWRQV